MYIVAIDLLVVSASFAVFIADTVSFFLSSEIFVNRQTAPPGRNANLNESPFRDYQDRRLALHLVNTDAINEREPDPSASSYLSILHSFYYSIITGLVGAGR